MAAFRYDRLVGDYSLMCYGLNTMDSALRQVSLALRNTMNGICWCPIRSLVRIGPFAFYRPDPKHAAHAIRAPGTFLLISHINTPIPAYFQTPISAGLSILHSALNAVKKFMAQFSQNFIARPAQAVDGHPRSQRCQTL